MGRRRKRSGEREKAYYFTMWSSMQRWLASSRHHAGTDSAIYEADGGNLSSYLLIAHQGEGSLMSEVPL